MADEPNPAQLRLPVWEIVKESFAFPFAHFPTLLRLGWFPAFALGGASLLIDIITPFGGFRGGAPRIHLGWSLGIGTLIQLAVAVSWSVAWMRLVLGIPEREVRLRFGRREWKYTWLFYGLCFVGGLFAMIFIVVLVVTIVLISHHLTTLGGVFARRFLIFWSIAFGGTLLLFLLAIWYRMILIFPAIAVDQYQGLRTSWRQTRDNFWRITTIITVISLPCWLLWWPLMRLFPRLHGATALTLMAVSFGVFAIFSSAFLQTAWALIYRRLVPEPPPSALAQAQAG